MVLVHGGCEHYPLPSPRLRDYCHGLVHAGADVVLCQHSHVIGAVETLNQAFISYGTGNLLFPYSSTRPAGWHDGYSVALAVCERGVASVRLIPHRFIPEKSMVETLGASEAESFAQLIVGLNSRAAGARQLQSEWKRFVLSRRRQYLTTLLGLTRPERLLLAAGIWPAWRMPRRMIPALLNTVRCESHNEA